MIVRNLQKHPESRSQIHEAISWMIQRYDWRDQTLLSKGGMNMTVNQFNYAQLAQTAYRDEQNALIGWANVREMSRHQQATEALEQQKVDESIRHNRQAEYLQQESNRLTDWYNQAWYKTSSSQAKSAALNAVSNAHNAATNSRNAATNRMQATETAQRDAWNYELGLKNIRLGQKQNMIAMRDASTRAKNAETAAYSARINAEVAHKNADTAAYSAKANAEVARENAAIARRNSNTARMTFYRDAVLGLGNLANQTGRTVTQGVGDAMSFAQSTGLNIIDLIGL
jgi:membrane protein involved in colicin uptake